MRLRARVCVKAEQATRMLAHWTDMRCSRRIFAVFCGTMMWLLSLQSVLVFIAIVVFVFCVNFYEWKFCVGCNNERTNEWMPNRTSTHHTDITNSTHTTTITSNCKNCCCTAAGITQGGKRLCCRCMHVCMLLCTFLFCFSQCTCHYSAPPESLLATLLLCILTSILLRSLFFALLCSLCTTQRAPRTPRATYMHMYLSIRRRYLQFFIAPLSMCTPIGCIGCGAAVVSQSDNTPVNICFCAADISSGKQQPHKHEYLCMCACVCIALSRACGRRLSHPVSVVCIPSLRRLAI